MFCFKFKHINYAYTLDKGNAYTVGHKRKTAFTLAEVLITLGIIGVVAAITLPALIQNYKRKTYSVKLKHFYSLMQQAIRLSEVDNGPAEDWDYNKNSYNEDGSLANVEESKSYALLFYNMYLKDYIKNDITDRRPNSSSSRFNVYLSDGSHFTIHNGNCIDIRYFIKESAAADSEYQFNFLLCGKNQIPNYHPLTKRAFGSYGQAGLTTRELALEKCKTSFSYCTVLLELYDNWELKSDYPYKL